MTNWSADITAIGALVRASVDDVSGLGTVPAGTAGVERGWREPERISVDELPHVFIFDPRSTEVAIDFAQAEITSTYRVELWADADQALLSSWRDAIVVNVALDPTLGGSVDRFRLTSSGILESFPGARDRRVLILEFSTLTVEG